MQNIKRVRGFFELKQLLMTRFQIDRDPNLVRLHFSVLGNRLYLHDYDRHENAVAICIDIADRRLPPNMLAPNAEEIVTEALAQKDPADFLNTGFQLHGTFLS